MISLVDNGIDGIPDGSKVVINNKIADCSTGSLRINVQYPESIIVKICDNSDDGIQVIIKCLPDHNTTNGFVIDQNYVRMRLCDDGYPPLSDQLDALWKGGSDAENMRSIILGVKKRYPK